MKTGSLKTGLKTLLISVLFTSCASTYNKIGTVSMLSDRPLKPGLVYKQLTTNSGASKKEIKHSKAESMQEAVNEVIATIPGGCFMTNVTIYVFADQHFAVSGNVWGAAADSIPYPYTGINTLASVSDVRSEITKPFQVQHIVKSK